MERQNDVLPDKKNQADNNKEALGRAFLYPIYEAHTVLRFRTVEWTWQIHILLLSLPLRTDADGQESHPFSPFLTSTVPTRH